MTSIVLGQAVEFTKKITLDLDVLLRTRLLVQANSGAGKSWLLRRLAEQLFGKVPVIIIDPEGEFATLRERYGYVLVGKGGETPADTRSASLVAHKLLELRASAVCDLYEMKPSDRHRWVRLFLESLIDSPKSLWRPLVVIVDESHQFAPEKGAGESEASDAMISLATRGRKRGFCAIYATQRLGKLRKDAAAELLNVLIGGTFIDIDRKRAADALGITHAEQRRFFDDIKVLRQGQFWALGRAISLERILISVGPVETTHPEPGSSKHAMEPPPPPEKVKALLPKLADLPKQAEEKARTEAELSGVIRSLRAQLAARPKETVEKSIEKRVEVPVLKDAQIKRIESAVNRAEKFRDPLNLYLQKIDVVKAGLSQAASEIMRAVNAVKGSQTPQNVIHIPVRATITARLKERTPSRESTPPPSGEASDLSPTQQRILDALAELEQLGAKAPERTLVALLAGYTNLASKGFVNAMSTLRTAGQIDYPSSRTVSLTPSGRTVARPSERPRSSEEIQDRIIRLLGGATGRILSAVIRVYPESALRKEVASEAGYTNLASKGFVNGLSRLRTLGFVEYPSSKQVVAQPVLFLES